MLRERVITALILGPVLLWVLLWASQSVAVSVIAAVILLGAWEWARFCGWNAMAARIGYAVVVGGAMFGATLMTHRAYGAALIYAIAVAWWTVAFAWLAFAPARVHNWMAACAGFLVLVPTWLALAQLEQARARGFYLLFLLVLVFAADIGAYFAGRTFGRIKLAPLVSPGKTWEGVLGGVVAAALVSALGAWWFQFPTVPFVALCLAVAAISVIGDLTESMFKRHVGLKDSSNLLPGHGGILDRIDSITAAAPVFALGLSWFGVL